MPDGLLLEERHRAALDRLFAEHLPEVEVRAYGSRVTGRAHEGSDLDLALRAPGGAEIESVRLGAFCRARAPDGGFPYRRRLNLLLWLEDDRARPGRAGRGQEESGMKIKAAVLYEPNEPMVVQTVDLDDPSDGEVLVRIGAAGVCHSDLHLIKGEWKTPLPAVLGHEGAGIVEKVGAGVTRVKPGDHVILNFRANCGHCHYCVVGRPVLCDGIDTPRTTMFDGTVRLHRNGEDIHHMARVSCFAEYAVVPESGAVPVRKDIPLDRACLIGCAVMTGVGAVANTANVRPGDTVAVIGCGGVGLNAVQGAALAGAERIVAVDLLDNKLEYARLFGATDTVNAGNGDAAARVLEMTGGGVDFAFEAIGNPAAIQQAYEMCRMGGTTVIVGMAPEEDVLEFNALSIPRTERAIVGSWYGSARPWVDLPRLADMYMRGRLKIDELISRSYPLEQINEAYDALQAGEVARSVLTFE